MITELGMLNVKGVTRDLSLGPVTLVQGGNFVGKTAIANAIRIGLLGYDPTLGKLASATYGLASGEKMMVNLALDTGATVCRTWELKRGKLVTGGDRDPLIEPMILDHNAYFGMTKQARVDYILGLAAEGAIGQEDITSAMQEIRRPIDPEAKPESFAEWKRMGLSVLDLLGAMDQEGATTTDVVDTLIESWTEAAKAAKALVAQMSGATQATEQFGEEAAARDQTKAIEAKQKDIEAVSQRLGTETVKERNRRKLELTLVAEINAEQVGANEDYIAQVRTDLEHRKADLESARKVLGETTAEKLQASVNAANDELKAVNKRKLEYEQELWMINKQIESGAATLKDLTNQDAVTNCKHCGSAKEHWKTTRDFKKEIEENIRQARVLMDKRDAVKAILVENIPALQSVAEDAVKTVSAALSEWYNLRDYANEQAQIISKQERDLASALGAGDRVAFARAMVEADGPDSADVLASRVKVIGDTADRLRGELRTLQAEQNRYARQCQQKLHAQQAAEERAKQEERLEILTDGVKAMKALKERASTEQWDGFIGTINLFCIGLLKEPIAFADGDIGYTENGRWVSHETMSGMEQALVYIGLGVALAAKSRIKIVVMDEMGILDRTNEGRVIETMKQLVESGVISQFVGMTSRAVEDIEGVEMIRL